MLADRLEDAGRVRAAQAEAEALLADPEAGPEAATAAAERLARTALRQGDIAAATLLGQGHAALAPGLRQQINNASRFCAQLRAETGQADPRLGLWLRVAQSTQRRGYPRYLPRRDAVLHLVAPPDVAACLGQAQAAAARGQAVTVLHASPVVPAAVPGLVQACLAEHALGATEALASAPDLAVPGGIFGEALRPDAVGQLLAALAALQPASLVIWGLPGLADAALAALSQGVPRLVLAATGPAPNLRPAASEAAQLRLAETQVALRAALLPGKARLWHADAAALPGWTAWLALSPDEAATLTGTQPPP